MHSHLHIVGEFDGLIFSVLKHDQFNNRPFPVHRMHRQLHPDRITTVRSHPRFGRDSARSAKTTTKFCLLLSVLEKNIFLRYRGN